MHVAAIPRKIFSQKQTYFQLLIVKGSLGDAVSPQDVCMLRLYPGRYLVKNKRIFNYQLSRACWVIENTFGILATKFLIFRRPIIANPHKITKLAKAACSLHNYLKILEASNLGSQRPYCPPGYIDREDGNVNLSLVTGGNKSAEAWSCSACI